MRRYDRHTAEVKRIKHTQLLGAMTPHAGQQAVGCLRIMVRCTLLLLLAMYSPLFGRLTGRAWMVHVLQSNELQVMHTPQRSGVVVCILLRMCQQLLRLCRQHLTAPCCWQGKCAIVQKLQPNEAGYMNVFKSLLPSVLDASPSFKDSLTSAMIAVLNDVKAQLPVQPTSDPYYFGVGHLAGVATGLFRISKHEAESQVRLDLLPDAGAAASHLLCVFNALMVPCCL